MTRPMPGPPEHRMDAHPHGGNGYCPVCHHLYRWRGPAKRLSAAECADEWEAAEEDAWDALADHIRGDKQGHAARFDRAKNAALTWARFATHPHALEEA